MHAWLGKPVGWRHAPTSESELTCRTNFVQHYHFEVDLKNWGTTFETEMGWILKGPNPLKMIRVNCAFKLLLQYAKNSFHREDITVRKL